MRLVARAACCVTNPARLCDHGDLGFRYLDSVLTEFI
jgi:hypothetical protein